MPLPPEVRVPLENERMLMIYQPAASESLDSFQEDETLRLHGYANVGNCPGYYFITNLGVHYCDSEKAGLFKKNYVSRFFPRSQMSHAAIDQIRGPENAYLRIYDADNKMVLVMWFDEEPWQTQPSLTQAQTAAEALGFS